jgi:hypothetical protein
LFASCDSTEINVLMIISSTWAQTF